MTRAETDELVSLVKSAQADAMMVSSCLRECATDPMVWADSVETKLDRVLALLAIIAVHADGAA